MTTSKIRKVKAWAVVDETIYKKDGSIFNLLFYSAIERFAHAIYPHEDAAKKHADRLFRLAGKQLVVPCTIIYSLPVKKKR